MSITTAKEKAVSRSITQVIRSQIRKTSTIWPVIATRVPSDGESENYAWLNDVPGMKEFLGERVFEELRASDYTLKNKTWEQSLGLDRIKIEDDQVGFYTPQARRLAQKAVIHPDKLLAELIVDGENQVCYDGQNFYDTDHAEGDSGTQSNLLTYDVVSSSKPTAEEFAGAFHQAMIQMLGYKTDQGDFWCEPEAMMMDENSLILLVTMDLLEVANKAVTIAFGDAGSTFHMMKRPKVLPMVRMGTVAGGSATKFDLLYTGCIIRPFIFQDRKRLVTQIKGNGADDIETKMIKVMTEARYNVGFGLWQMAVRTKLVQA